MNKISISLILFSFFNLNLQAQEPFVCRGDFYLSLAEQNQNSQFYRVDIDPLTSNVTFNELANIGGDLVNSIGYRITDNLIYGLQPDDYKFYKIDSNGDTFLQTTLDLEASRVYTAADITPSGDTMVIVGASFSYVSDELLFIDLNAPDYAFTSIPLVYPNGGSVFTTDVAFDPITGMLWGFDALAHRLITIDIETGEVDNTSFPAQNVADALGAMFFDPFGNLFGYGNPPSSNSATQLYSVDKNTGLLNLEASGPVASRKDGCSCPYTIKLQKSVYPEISFPCTEVTYSFEIANLSGQTRTGIDFLDEMPENLILTEILQNPFQGNLTGLGTNVLEVENMTIPVGIDSIIVKVYVEEDSEGIYKNQAKLTNLPSFLGEETLSDNPKTLVNNDSTCLEIIPFFVDLENDTVGICNGEDVFLNAEELEGLNVTYQWNSGETTPSLNVNSSGVYAVTVTSGCQTVFDSTYVTEALIDIELGEDISLELGESIELSPDILTGTPFSYFWQSDLDGILNCDNCPIIEVLPYSDASFIVEIYDEFGCQDIDTIQVFVDKTRHIFIPNAFSPDDDGINDVFYIHSKGLVKINYFQIYDRWGNLVFETKEGITNDTSFGWNGEFKGQDMNSSVFVYVAELEFVDGVSALYEGDLVLVR